MTDPRTVARELRSVGWGIERCLIGVLLDLLDVLAPPLTPDDPIWTDPAPDEPKRVSAPLPEVLAQ